MRCSCGKPAIVRLERRELPYCHACLERMLATAVRHEIGDGPVRLQPIEGYFLEAAKAVCALARRELVYDEQGAVPGCTETQAAAVLRASFGGAQERHFPLSITLQELQTFFKAEQPVELDSITQELIAFDKQHPGTTRSIAKQAPR